MFTIAVANPEPTQTAQPISVSGKPNSKPMSDDNNGKTIIVISDTQRIIK